MQKEKKQLLQSIFAQQVKKFIPDGIGPSRIAMENGISTSVMSKIVRGIKNPSLTTIYQLAFALDTSLVELISAFEDNLPKPETILDI